MFVHISKMLRACILVVPYFRLQLRLSKLPFTKAVMLEVRSLPTFAYSIPKEGKNCVTVSVVPDKSVWEREYKLKADKKCIRLVYNIVHVQGINSFSKIYYSK